MGALPPPSWSFWRSADDSLHCLDAATGQSKWTFVTDGPVRLPPTWHKGKLYFGSDDGRAYCLNAADGELVWAVKPSTDDRLVASNGKLISPWPVRTGVLVQDGRAYFGASLLPWEASYLCAADEDTGATKGDGLYLTVLANVTLQGAMLASQDNLYVLQGRSPPLVFRLKDGANLGPVRGPAGGVYALLTEDARLIHGHGSKTGWLAVHGDNSRDLLAAMPNANRVVQRGPMAYVQQANEITALNQLRYFDLLSKRKTLSASKSDLTEQRDKLEKDGNEQRQAIEMKLKTVDLELESVDRELQKCRIWSAKGENKHCVVLAGGTLLAGQDDAVIALDISDGKQIWRAALDGAAHGLAVANGRLYVSTSRGEIHCFK